MGELAVRHPARAEVLPRTPQVLGPQGGQDPWTLATWARRYLEEVVLGGPRETVTAKLRDLRKWGEWFLATNGSGDVRHWLRRDTEAFKRHLEAKGYKPASVNRTLATVKHFAGYLRDRGLFPEGSPVYGVRNIPRSRLRPKGLGEREVHWLLKASDLIRRAKGDGFASVRDQAILLTLLHTGLRVSELCELAAAQLDGKWLRNVKGKGMNHRDIFLPKDVRESLDEYLSKREAHVQAQAKRWEALDEGRRAALATRFPGRIPDPRCLFLNRYGAGLTRQAVFQGLRRVAAYARAQGGVGVHLHPHRLRHTFALDLLERADEAFVADRLGHQSMQHIRVYTQRDEAAVEAILEGKRAAG
jgi:site-specific recombinase XerD